MNTNTVSMTAMITTRSNHKKGLSREVVENISRMKGEPEDA